MRRGASPRLSHSRRRSRSVERRSPLPAGRGRLGSSKQGLVNRGHDKRHTRSRSSKSSTESSSEKRSSLRHDRKKELDVKAKAKKQSEVILKTTHCLSDFPGGSM